MMRNRDQEKLPEFSDSAYARAERRSGRFGGESFRAHLSPRLTAPGLARSGPSNASYLLFTIAAPASHTENPAEFGTCGPSVSADFRRAKYSYRIQLITV
jgi:hypothetical protein